MTTYLQYHILTSFGPSNANRDDLGRHKEANIGGTTRLRHSSQSRKRAIRESQHFSEALSGNKGVRTKRLYDCILSHIDADGANAKKASEVAEKVAGIFGKIESSKKNGEDKKIASTMVFISPEERELAYQLAERLIAGEKISDKEIKSLVLRKADSAVDIAMFGRMLANDADFSRDAAVQVAHAFTTHATVAQEDWFSAADDLIGEGDSGAGHIGEAHFGSGVFYQYVNVNLDLLIKNLGGDRELAEKAVAALSRALAESTPSGKQNSFANHPRAYYMLVERGHKAPRDLSGAFFNAIKGDNLLDKSVSSLEGTRKIIDEAYEAPVDAEVVFYPGHNATKISDVAKFAEKAVEEA